MEGKLKDLSFNYKHVVFRPLD